MKQTTILAIVIGVLIIIAGVQAYQFSELKTRLTSGGATVSTATQSSGGTPSLPSNLQNLPDMVGGC